MQIGQVGEETVGKQQVNQVPVNTEETILAETL